MPSSLRGQQQSRPAKAPAHLGRLTDAVDPVAEGKRATVAESVDVTLAGSKQLAFSIELSLNLLVVIAFLSSFPLQSSSVVAFN